MRAVDWSSEDDPLSSPGDDDSFNLGRGALGDQAPEKAFEESLHEAVNAIESIIERASDSAIAAQSTISLLVPSEPAAELSKATREVFESIMRSTTQIARELSEADSLGEQGAFKGDGKGLPGQARLGEDGRECEPQE